MFINRSSRPDEVYSFYFSPGAVRIFGAKLKVEGAVDCDAPKRAEVDLLVGHDAAKELLPEA